VADARDPIELAARALRHRDRSREQLDDRLERAGVAEEARAEALETLERLGYLDDERFAVTRAASLAERGYGDEGIRQRLAADGIAEAAAAAAIAALEPELRRALRIAAGRGASPRTAQHLQRKGFGEDAVAAVGGEGIAEQESEA